jgi:hypothetical protein
MAGKEMIDKKERRIDKERGIRRYEAEEWFRKKLRKTEE